MFHGLVLAPVCTWRVIEFSWSTRGRECLCMAPAQRGAVFSVDSERHLRGVRRSGVGGWLMALLVRVVSTFR